MDRLEDDLRRVLTDPRRTLPPDLVTLEGVHRGATRRRRVRTAGAALATVVVLAGGVAVGVTQLGGSGGDGSLPAAHSPSVSAPVTPTTGTTPTPSTATSQSAPTLIAAGLQPRSFTAIGTDTWFVLATDASCSSAHPCGSQLLTTADGGRTFRRLTAPPAQWTEPGKGSTDTISDVRFGSARDGWAFGGGLWSTHDGGRTWHRVAMPGQVVDVEAGAGVAWAVVDRSDGSRALMSSDVSVDGFADSTPSWATPSTLAVDGKHVVVWASATSAAVPHGGEPSLLSTTDAGRSWALVPTPSCSPDLGGRVAASGGGVWLACPTGTAAAVFPSPLTDASAELPSAPLGNGSLPNSVLVAPRDASTAALGLDADGIATVSSSGKVLHRSDVGGAPLWMGFTTPKVGYAIVSLDAGGSRLVRTTDGGATWAKVPLG
jgi:hypothetical protein